MRCNFSKGNWSMDGLMHAYSSRFTQDKQFVQQDDCIENPVDPNMRDGYGYISLITDKKMKPGVRLTTHCAFYGLAAPLVVIVKDLFEKNGLPSYGDYQEVVLWKNGMNVWNLWMKEDGNVEYHKLVGIRASLEEEKIHELVVDVLEDGFEITMDGQKLYVRDEHIYPEFYLGITGCEGLCKFYDMEISEICQKISSQQD